MVFNNSILLGAAGQGGAVAPFDPTLIGNSIWLEGAGTSGDAATKVWGAESNQDRWIWATWYQPLRVIDAESKRNNLFASGSAATGFYLNHTSTSSTFNLFHRDNAGTEGSINTTESYRDTTSWIHVLVDYDSANANAANRISLYVNGVRTGVNSGNRPGQNNHLNTNVNGQTARIGQDLSSTPNYHVQGYLAQTVFLDNKSIANGDLAITDFLDTFTFGTNGSQIVPKKDSDIIALASAAGNNSFCLDYSDSSNIVNDASSKSNNFTPTGGGSPTITSANQSISTPSKVYSVFNPLANADPTLPATFTLSEGNQKIAINNSDTSVKMTLPFIMSGSNIIRTQFTFDSVGQIGVGITGSSHTSGTYHTAATSVAGRGEVAFFTNAGALGLVIDGNFNNPAFGGSDGLSDGDVVDVIVNCNVGAVYFAVNGTIKGGASQADIQNGVTTNAAQAGGSFVRRTAGEVFNFYAMQVNPSGGTITANTGQSAFTHSYSSITSLTSLNTADLPTPDFQGIDYFDATLYEGNGNGQRVGDFVPFTDSYTVTNSVMFEDGDSRSLTLNSSATRTSATVAAFSLWTKRANLGTNQRPLTVQVDSNNYFSIYYNTSDQLDFTINNGGATILQRITTRVFKDNSAWHNIVVIINQGEGTQADRVKIFYDGVQISNDSTGFGTNTCTLDGSSALNFLDSASAVHDVGGGSSTGFTQAYDGYVSEVAFLDGADSGAKLNASDFGQVDTSTNRWVPKDIGSYNFGNTGYYLEFKVAPGTSNGAGTDTSGESNNFTSNGSWATTDQFTDTPSKNYPIVRAVAISGKTYSEGNLKVSSTSGFGNGNVLPTFPLQKGGYWYWEIIDAAAAANQTYGIAKADAAANASGLGGDTKAWGFYNNQYRHNGNIGAVPDSPTNTGTRYMFAVDVDEGKFWMGNDGTWWKPVGGSTAGNPAAGTNPAFTDADIANGDTFPAMDLWSSDSATFVFNQNDFAHSAPTGYSEINQDNLDDTASKITAWAWIKNRDADDSHILVDRVRGVGKDLHSDSDTSSGLAPAEATNMNTVQRFLQRGVQVGNDVEVNTANESYVLWQWLVGDSATTGTTFAVDSISSGVPNLASTALVADADHFAIVSYTGAGGSVSSSNTIRHGMSAAPEMIWIKERDNANGWIVGSDVVGYTKMLRLDTKDGETTDSGSFNNTAPTSTLITLGSNNGTNRSSGKMICYAFRSVPGVCKVGSYTGNGDNDGPYISVGFLPKYVLVKSTTANRNWNALDTTRNPTNIASPFVLLPNDDAVDTAGQIGAFDILADGFKPRDTAANSNASNETYLYMAIADIGGNGTLPPIYGR